MKNIIALLLILGISTSLFGQNKSVITDVKGPGAYNITAYDRNQEGGLSGYFDTEFVLTDDAFTFKHHRLILEASKQIHEKLLFNTEIEFEYGGAINSFDDNGRVNGLLWHSS